MKKFILLLIPFFFSAILLANPGKLNAFNDTLIVKNKVTIKNTQGVVVETYQLKKGEKHGARRVFNNQAGLVLMEQYKKGKLDGLKKFHGEKTNALFYAWANTWLMPTFKSWNIVAEIKGIDCPSIIIQGKDDQYGTEKQVSEIVSALSNAEGVMLENCKHHPHLEKTNEVIELIKENF